MAESPKPIEDTPENNAKDLSELLPSIVEIANRINSGMRSTKGDAYKYVELAIEQTKRPDGTDKHNEIKWHGADEVDIADWDYKVEDYVAKENYFNKEFIDLVKECGLLTDEERDRLIGDESKKIEGINEVAMNYIAKQLYLRGKAIFEKNDEGESDGNDVTGADREE